MESDRFAAFLTKVRELWSTYKAGDEEIKARIWGPRLAKMSPDVIGQALQRHAAENPDSIKPNWARVYGLIAERAGSGSNDLEILIRNYRRDKNPKRHAQFERMSDSEIWQYFVDAQVYPILFRFGGKGRPPRPARDPEFAKRQAKQCVANTIESWSEVVREAGDEVPPWLGNACVRGSWVEALDRMVCESNETVEV